MAVVITLTRHGQKKVPFYRVVAKEKGTKRDGKFIEILGTYDPLQDPAEISLKEDRVRYWIECGAQTTSIANSIIKKSYPGYLEGIEENRRNKVLEARRARKQRAQKKAA